MKSNLTIRAPQNLNRQQDFRGIHSKIKAQTLLDKTSENNEHEMSREMLDPSKYHNAKFGDMVAVINKQKDPNKVLIRAIPKKELAQIAGNPRASMYRGVSKNGPSWQVRHNGIIFRH